MIILNSQIAFHIAEQRKRTHSDLTPEILGETLRPDLPVTRERPMVFRPDLRQVNHWEDDPNETV
jgi:hypothetical protein